MRYCLRQVQRRPTPRAVDARPLVAEDIDQDPRRAFGIRE